MRQTVMFLLLIGVNSFGEITHSLNLKIYITYLKIISVKYQNCFLFYIILNMSFLAFWLLYSFKNQINTIDSNSNTYNIQSSIKYFSEIL